MCFTFKVLSWLVDKISKDWGEIFIETLGLECLLSVKLANSKLFWNLNPQNSLGIWL